MQILQQQTADADRHENAFCYQIPKLGISNFKF